MNKNTQIRINCEMCGSSIVRNSNRQKYCYGCAKKKKYYSRITKRDKTNICVICRNEFIGRQRNQKVCQNPFCREDYYLAKFKKHYFKIEDLKRFMSRINRNTQK